MRSVLTYVEMYIICLCWYSNQHAVICVLKRLRCRFAHRCSPQKCRYWIAVWVTLHVWYYSLHGIEKQNKVVQSIFVQLFFSMSYCLWLDHTCCWSAWDPWGSPLTNGSTLAPQLLHHTIWATQPYTNHGMMANDLTPQSCGSLSLFTWSFLLHPQPSITFSVSCTSIYYLSRKSLACATASCSPYRTHQPPNQNDHTVCPTFACETCHASHFGLLAMMFCSHLSHHSVAQVTCLAVCFCWWAVQFLVFACPMFYQVKISPNQSIQHWSIVATNTPLQPKTQPWLLFWLAVLLLYVSWYMKCKNYTLDTHLFLLPFHHFCAMRNASILSSCSKSGKWVNWYSNVVSSGQLLFCTGLNSTRPNSKSGAPSNNLVCLSLDCLTHWIGMPLLRRSSNNFASMFDSYRTDHGRCFWYTLTNINSFCHGVSFQA